MFHGGDPAMLCVSRNERFPAYFSMLLLGLVVAVGGCGGSGGSSTHTTSSSGLWVPNFFSNNMTAFTSKLVKTSGEPVATITNVNGNIIQPEEVLFDKKGNLWITNCSDLNIGVGTIA